MFLYGKKLYEVLERCGDLFPAWQKEGNQYWNRNTGEMVDKNGVEIHDGVLRPFPDPDGYGITNTPEEPGSINTEGLTSEHLKLYPLRVTYSDDNLASASAEDGNDSLLVDPFAVLG